MARKQELDPYDVLAEAMLALRDHNNEVLVQTLDAKKIGHRSWLYLDGKPGIPTYRTKGVSFSENAMHATSLKIGKNITIKRINRPSTRVKTQKHEYDVLNGSYYLIRTPQGEAMFDVNEPDMQAVWGYALARYDRPDSFNYMAFATRFKNKKVHKAYAGPAVLENKKSKYDKAIEQLEALGVKPDRLMAYIAKRKEQEEKNA